MPIADDLVAAFKPWMTSDLETYLRVVGSMFSGIEELTEGADGLWTILDPDLAPVEVLPYLAQYVGETLPMGLSEPAMREWIKDAPNQIRGTFQSVIRAAQRTLEGQRTVQIRERYGADDLDDPDRLVINTYVSETPFPASVRADLDTVVPGDIELVYSTLTGQTWQDVRDAYDSWQEVADDTDTWEDLRAPMPGFTTYTRPRPW